ncbi:MAG: type II secretion system minor pseudopilin GspI [Steroidobacteraceae bacterium]|nr:type II secretion system minor pseudopilin GspI [Steroidobacteraceae bacterium]
MRARGFTLVEVLVALVIVAAGAAAVLSSLNAAAVSTTYLRDKTFAGWIAENRIAELRLQTTPPQNGRAEGDLDYAGQRWRWRQEITNAQIPGVRRIDVSVRPVVPGMPPATAAGSGAGGGAAVDEGWTVTLSGVLGGSLAGPGGPIDWDGQPGTAPGGGAQPGGASPGDAGGSGGAAGQGRGAGGGAPGNAGASLPADASPGSGIQVGSP